MVKNDVFMESFLLTYRPSGYEKEAAEKFVELATRKPDIKKEFIDKMWNACVSVGSDKPDAKKILISGHSDQNCLIVTEITKNGFLKYATQGGISPKTVIDSDMFVIVEQGKENKYIPCFCSYKAIHLEEADDRKKCPKHTDLVLDLGCTSDKEVEELGVKIGDLVVFDNSNLKMNFGPSGKFIVGSGLDDGVACGIVYDVLTSVDPFWLNDNNIRLYAACLTSEETGARGVYSAINKIQPDVSIDIDVCHDCTKEIGGDKNETETEMGKGPVIGFGPDKYRPLSVKLRELAVDNDIPFQIQAGKAGGTNTNEIQMFSNNCETALLSIPCRYMHSSTHEMVNKDDIENCSSLIKKYICNLGE